MRMSDWSADVCSSDLRPPACEQAGGVGCGRIRSPAGKDGGVKAGERVCHGGFLRDVLASRQKPVPPSTGKSRPRAATGLPCRCIGFQMADISPRRKDPGPEIGRASCRVRVCQYVSISVVAVPIKKKEQDTHNIT